LEEKLMLLEGLLSREFNVRVPLAKERADWRRPVLDFLWGAARTEEDARRMLMMVVVEKYMMNRRDK
jgi:hypothetical protein